MRFKAWEKKKSRCKIDEVKQNLYSMDLSGTFRVVHPEKIMLPGCVN